METRTRWTGRPQRTEEIGGVVAMLYVAMDGSYVVRAFDVPHMRLVDLRAGDGASQEQAEILFGDVLNILRLDAFDALYQLKGAK